MKGADPTVTSRRYRPKGGGSRRLVGREAEVRGRYALPRSTHPGPKSRPFCAARRYTGTEAGPAGTAVEAAGMSGLTSVAPARAP